MKTDRDVRTSAARALEAMGAAAGSAVPDLVEMLASDRHLAFLATRVLGSIGPKARAAVPALIKRLNDKNPSDAAYAGVALLRIDPSVRDAVEARLRSIPMMKNLYCRAILTGALRQRTREADGFARGDLRSIDRLLQGLIDLTGDDGLSAQEDELDQIAYSMDRLSSLGTGAESAIGRLTELTHHSDPEVGHLASETLKRIRPR